MFKLFQAISENKELSQKIKQLSLENQNITQKIEQLRKELTQTRANLGKAQIGQSESLKKQREIEDRMQKARQGYRNMQLKLQSSEQQLTEAQTEIKNLKKALAEAQKSPPPKEAPPPAPQAAPPPRRTPESPKETQILLIDNSLTTQTLMKRILEASQYQVNTAKTEDEGKALCQRLAPHLIIVGENVPNLDGFAFKDWLLENFPEQQMPLILITAYANDEFLEQLQSSGIEGYINKAKFNQDTFLETVKTALHPS